MGRPPGKTKTLDEFKADHENDTPERLKRNLDRLMYQYKNAEATGQERMGPRINWLEEKLGLQPSALQPPSKNGDSPAAATAQIKPEEAQKYAQMGLFYLSKILTQVLKRPIELTASPESMANFSNGLMLVLNKRLPANWQERADIPLLLLGVGGIVMENLDKLKKPEEKTEPEKPEPKKADG